MESLQEKYTKTSRGLTYRYYITEETAASAKNPAVFFLHGFRGLAMCWQYMLPYLTKTPCRLIFLDLLGHGKTSRPGDTKLYEYRAMAQDMFDIADAEKSEKLILVGHDHGAGLAARIYNHFPDRIAALVLLCVAYPPPNKGAPFIIPQLNAMSKKLLGYTMAEYWYFLTAPDAAGVMNANLDRVWDIPHAQYEDMKRLYTEPNAMREYLTDPSVPRVKVRPYADDEKLKAAWMAQMKEGGLEGPLSWYTVNLQQIQSESEKLIAEENYTVRCPLLYIACDDDPPCPPELINFPKDAGLLPDLTVRTLHGVGHFPMYEEPKRSAEFITEFLAEKMGLS